MAPHLALEEREWIAQGHAAGRSRRAIAERLGRSPSRISRELRRNRSRGGVFPSGAQRRADQRRRSAGTSPRPPGPPAGRSAPAAPCRLRASRGRGRAASGPPVWDRRPPRCLPTFERGRDRSNGMTRPPSSCPITGLLDCERCLTSLVPALPYNVLAAWVFSGSKSNPVNVQPG
jgi:hypothetical protein